MEVVKSHRSSLTVAGEGRKIDSVTSMDVVIVAVPAGAAAVAGAVAAAGAAAAVVAAGAADAVSAAGCCEYWGWVWGTVSAADANLEVLVLLRVIL